MFFCGDLFSLCFQVLQPFVRTESGQEITLILSVVLYCFRPCNWKLERVFDRCSVRFLLATFSLLWIDVITPQLHLGNNHPEGLRSKLSRIGPALFNRNEL